MTLELKYSKEHTDRFIMTTKKPFLLNGVKEITNDTIYGYGHFAITIFDKRIYFTDCFEYVKDKDSNTYYVKDGKWVFNKGCEQ